MKIYAAIANALHIHDTDTGMPQEWRVNAALRLEYIIDNYLPHGSGFDVAPAIEHDGTPQNTFTISGSFHKMDEHGGYDGWADFTIKVFAQANLVTPWDFSIECEDKELEDYIADTYSTALKQEYYHEV